MQPQKRNKSIHVLNALFARNPYSAWHCKELNARAARIAAPPVVVP